MHAMVSLGRGTLGCSHSLTDLALQVQEEDSGSHLERRGWMLMFERDQREVRSGGEAARGTRASSRRAGQEGRWAAGEIYRMQDNDAARMEEAWRVCGRTGMFL